MDKKDFSKWYNDIIKKAHIAEMSAVRGCFILKPYGYAIWEKIKNILDKKIKETGHQNVYFPLLIPKSYFSKEANHVEGFAKECAVVTHYKLKLQNKKIEVDDNARLEEELIIRPTSETMIWDTYSRWIQSYKDLPLLLNQWANIVRWEMRTRMFLRTTEILWQEGHTAHATEDEARKESIQMLDLYANFIENYLAISIVKGQKSENEKFAGAEITYTIELLTQEGKALQAGTSHFLGTNFAKAFNVKFIDKNNKLNYVWGTSWGVTTRLVGALIMAHSDNKGLVLPPKIAPIEVVIIPIYKGRLEIDKKILEETEKIHNLLEGSDILVKSDTRDYHRPGWKFAEYELQGIPLRITLGPRDIENNEYELFRRDLLTKQMVHKSNILKIIKDTLVDIQSNLLKKTTEYKKNFTTEVKSYSEFKEVLKTKKGFILAYWDGTKETEKIIKEETKATIRCILESNSNGKCVFSQKKSKYKVLFAEAY